MAAGDVSAFQAIEFALVLLAVGLWASHVSPGTGGLRRVRPGRDWPSDRAAGTDPGSTGAVATA